MGKLVFSRSTSAPYSCFVFLVLVLSGKVAAGRVHYDQLLLSDGASVSDHDSFLRDHLKGIGMETETQTKFSEGNSSSCHQMYGFLPCSTNLAGHIFLIVLYEYLLYCGEFYVSRDARDLFGNSDWGALCFQLLNSLPEPLVLAASVAWTKNIEDAQEHLSVAFGLLVGSSILLLTVVWGFCIIFGGQKFYSEGTQSNNWLQQLLTGSGVITSEETTLRAIYMLFSLVPFVIILIVYRGSSASGNSLLLPSLVAALLNRLVFRSCQCYRESIIESWTYSEIERKMEMRVPFYEVQVLMRHRNKHLMRMGIEMEKKIRSNDHNDNMIGTDGASVSFKEWFFQNIQKMEDPNPHKKFNKVAQYLLEEKSSLMERIDHIVKQTSLDTHDEEDRKASIDRVFKKMDRDGSSSVDPSELEHFLVSTEKDHKPVDKEVLEMIMAHLDVDRNGKIDRAEFENGIAEWGWEIEQLRNHNITDKEQEDKEKARKEGIWKAFGFVAFGFFMLGFFAEPLTHSVQILSESFSIQPFYISFIFLPVATQARTTFAAFGAVQQKRYLTTSSTLSEIYNKVLMNNLMGFSLLLCVMIYRGLTWHFSAEVLILVIVGGIMGMVGFFSAFSSKFPNWTLIIAFPLYPLSLIFYIFVNAYF